MNVFVLDNCPKVAAQLQVDKHVIKMVIESGQMLSTAHRLLDGELVLLPVSDEAGNPVYLKSGKRKMAKYWKMSDTREDELYKAVHMNHPCTIWTRESSANYDWHYRHFVSLCDEYTYRYNRVHKTDEKLRKILATPPVNIPKWGMTEFPLAMKSNPECIVEGDAVQSYRNFYQTKQTRFKMVWTKREQPEWFKRVI